MEADISILRKTGHFYFALTSMGATGALNLLELRNLATAALDLRGGHALAAKGFLPLVKMLVCCFEKLLCCSSILWVHADADAHA